MVSFSFFYGQFNINTVSILTRKSSLTGFSKGLRLRKKSNLFQEIASHM